MCIRDSSSTVPLELVVVLPRHVSETASIAAHVHSGVAELLPLRLTIYKLPLSELSGIFPLGIPLSAWRNTHPLQVATRPTRGIIYERILRPIATATG